MLVWSVVYYTVRSFGFLVQQLASDQPESVGFSVFGLCSLCCLALHIRPAPLVFCVSPGFFGGQWSCWLGVPWEPIKSKQERSAQTFRIRKHLYVQNRSVSKEIHKKTSPYPKEHRFRGDVRGTIWKRSLP